MSWEDSRGLGLVPKEAPPRDPLQLFARGVEGVPEQLIRSAQWANALLEKFDREELWRQVACFESVAAGFLNPDTELDAFGLIAYSSMPMPKPVVSYDAVRIGEYRFPIAVRHVRYQRHQLPCIHPSFGIATCAAHSTRLDEEGLLTARHVLGEDASRGTSVATTYGKAFVLDVAPAAIDAAIFSDDGACHRHRGEAFLPRAFLAPWEDVAFRDHNNIVVQGKITAISETRGVFDPRLQSLFYISVAGRPGDSGALVYDAKEDGVGIYLGAVTGAGGAVEGYCQNLFQAANSLSLQLFR